VPHKPATKKAAANAARLRQAEAEARQVAAMVRAAAGCVLWRYDAVSDEYEINPDFGGACLRRPGELIRRSIHPEDAARVQASFQRSLESGAPGATEYRDRAPSGDGWRRLRVTWRGAPARSGAGWDIIGAAQDITELAEARDAAVSGEKAARAAVEAKSLFLANISHEIRTPMNGILGVLHLIKADPPAPERKRLIDQALAAAGGLSDVLNDIIDFSSVEAGRAALAPEAADPAETLRGLAASFQASADAKGVRFSTCFPEHLGWMALDVAHLRKIFFHLVSNAVKFTPQGFVEARLSASGDGEARRLRIEVEDTGVGVAPEAQAGLFERFTQADSSMTRPYGGQGLGLSITKGLVELMGGEVGFAPRQGGGSVFWAEAPAPAASAPAPAAALDEDGWLAGVKVLVVEDNPTNRLIATRMLGQMGAVVSTAANGAEGVAAMERANFDLVFMDIQMPVMDGCEASRRIRALPAPKGKVPIVATTANVMPKELAAYRDCGINGVVAKPISPASLLAEVVKVAQAA